MNLAELKEAYKARKLALDSAKKEEEKYKALLKDAMLEAGESDYTDEAGYRFERIVQERKSMDEEKKEAVNAPADEKQEQEKGTEAPTEGAVSPEVTPEQEEKKEDKPKKVYHFTSENPYLTVSAVGVYFSNGKASTDNLAVAKYLAGLEGVELVEE